MIISGTVRSAVKLAQLDSKWQQKKAEGNILKKDMDPETRQINQYKEDLAKMREGNKMSEITSKIKSGSELTPEEIDYLKKNNPSAYKDYLEIQQEKENYEKELKSCKTKDEVEELKVTRLGQFAAEAKRIKNNPYIPEGQKVQLMGKILAKTMGIEKVHLEFVNSVAYQNLPTDEELAEEKREDAEVAVLSTEQENGAEGDKPVTKAYRQTEKTSVQEHLGEGASITISPESQEFLSGVQERKAAQRAEKEALRGQYFTNPFAYCGNALSLSNLATGERVAQEPMQWRVFSESLYKNGFYDNMSDEEVGKMEGMLKSITSGVESICGLTDSERSYSELSHEAAKLEFISSINALNYFAATYVPDEMRGFFQDLVKAYEDYNSESVAKHKNSGDLYSEAMAKIPATNAVNVKEMQGRTAASQAIGKVTHTDEEEAKQRQDYQALFDSLIYQGGSVNSIFDDLKNSLINYAAGGSKNADVLALLNSRNAGSINNMADYWSKLLSV